MAKMAGVGILDGGVDRDNSPETRNTKTVCVLCFWNRRQEYMQRLSMGIERIRYYSWSLIIMVLSQGCGFRTFFGTLFTLIFKCASQFIQLSLFFYRFSSLVSAYVKY